MRYPLKPIKIGHTTNNTCLDEGKADSLLQLKLRTVREDNPFRLRYGMGEIKKGRSAERPFSVMPVI